MIDHAKFHERMKISKSAKFIYLLFGALTLVFVLATCTSAHKEAPIRENVLSLNAENTDTIKIKFEPGEKRSIGEIMEDVEFHDLPNKEGVLIGEVNKLEIIDNKYLFTDDHNFYCYSDSNKNYLYQITAKGKGPGEFIEITDFFYDTKNNELGIYDRSLRKVLIYDLQKGEFMKEESLSLSIPADNLTKYNDDFFITALNNIYAKEEDRYNIMLLNKKGEILSRNIRIPEEWLNIALAQRSEGVQFNGEIFSYTNVFNRSIYHIDPTTNMITKKYMFDFGKFNIQDEKLFNNNINSIENMSKKNMYFHNSLDKLNYILGPVKSLETKNHILFKNNFENKIVIGAYCKSTNQSYMPESFEVPFGVPEMFNHFPIATTGDYFVSLIYPGEIIAGLKKMEKHIGKQEYNKYIESDLVMNFFAGLNANDNPVFMKIKLADTFDK